MKILKCYGAKEVLDGIIKTNLPKLENYRFLGKCNDFQIEFPDISDEKFEDVSELLDDYIYNDTDISLAETLSEFLKSNGIFLATAESCTGGMLASSLVDVEGASSFFYEGLVTYSNVAKMERLGVRRSTLEKFGAVSEETAMEMANGLLGDVAKLAIAITGIAGPTGGTLEKPVGLVYIAIATENSCEVKKNIFEGNRRNIRTTAKNAALFYAYKHVLKYY